MSTETTIERTDTTDTKNKIIDIHDIRIQIRLISLLLAGLVLLFFSVQQIVTIWTPKSSLISLKGTLENCDVYITTVNAPDRYKLDHFSQKVELIFYLQEYKKKFSLAENIDNDYSDNHYSEIKNRLSQADTITVWIRKSEVEYWQPKVFSIDTNKGPVLDFDTVRFKDRPLTLFMLLLGLCFVILPIYCFYPNLFKIFYTPKKISS